jgi:hypothetical protein
MIVSVAQALTVVNDVHNLFLSRCFSFVYQTIWWLLFATRVLTIHEQTLTQFLMGCCVLNFFQALLFTVAFLVADLLVFIVVYCAVVCYMPVVRMLLDIAIQIEHSYHVLLFLMQRCVV